MTLTFAKKVLLPPRSGHHAASIRLPRATRQGHIASKLSFIFTGRGGTASQKVSCIVLNHSWRVEFLWNLPSRTTIASKVT